MDDLLEGCMLAVFAVIFVATVLGFIVYGTMYFIYNIPTEQVTITVDHKESIAKDNSYSYLVWTKSGETFEIRDSLLHMRYDSSDFYNKIEEGETYCVVVTGKRIHFLSWYRNILRFCDTNDGEMR